MADTNFVFKGHDVKDNSGKDTKHPKRADNLKHPDKTNNAPAEGVPADPTQLEDAIDEYVLSHDESEISEDGLMQYLLEQGFEEDDIVQGLSAYDDYMEDVAEEAAEEDAQEEAARTAHEETGFDDLQGGTDWAGNTDTEVDVVDQTDGTQPDEVQALINAYLAMPDAQRNAFRQLVTVNENAPSKPTMSSAIPKIADDVDTNLASDKNVKDAAPKLGSNTSALAKLISEYKM